jgi:hypothetical protein
VSQPETVADPHPWRSFFGRERTDLVVLMREEWRCYDFFGAGVEPHSEGARGPDDGEFVVRHEPSC